MSEAPKTVPGGLVVFFEGIDGVGKTTQLENAAESLQGEGWLVRTTRGHGGTPIGEELRKVSFMPLERSPNTNLFLSMAIHNELGEQVKKWRQEGAITLIDRGPLSMAAYQIYADGCDPQLGWREVTMDIARFQPELMILYTAALDVALDRARSRNAKTDYFESKPRDYFAKVEAGFMETSQRYDVTEIDADRPVEAVQVDTMAAIRNALNARSIAAD